MCSFIEPFKYFFFYLFFFFCFFCCFFSVCVCGGGGGRLLVLFCSFLFCLFFLSGFFYFLFCFCFVSFFVCLFFVGFLFVCLFFVCLLLYFLFCYILCTFRICDENSKTYTGVTLFQLSDLAISLTGPQGSTASGKWSRSVDCRTRWTRITVSSSPLTTSRPVRTFLYSSSLGDSNSTVAWRSTQQYGRVVFYSTVQ